MSFFDKLKSKAQEVFHSGDGSSSSFSGSSQSHQQQDQSHSAAWTHEGHHLDFSANHLRSQNAQVPQPGTRQPGPGRLPPRLKSHKYHPAMRFLHPSGQTLPVMRDLGFTGVLGGRIIWTWGDTLMGTKDQCMICAVDSTSIGTLDAKGVVLDSALAPGTNNVRNWIDCLPDEAADGGLGKYAFGGTNIIEYPPGSGKGYVFYLKNSRPGGQNEIKGAGIATVTIGDDNIPHSSRIGKKLWSQDEPWYGDVGATFNAQDGFIYAYGHGPMWDDELSSRTFLARVPADKATDVNAYEYWKNGDRVWTKQRVGRGNDGTQKLEQRDAIFDWHVMNQAVPFWSNYFNRWMFVHGSSWPASDVLVRTAEKLEGPWEDHGGFVSTGPNGDEQGYRYCINAHPEYDDSGKTVYVTWTRENTIYGVTLEWE